MKVVSSDAAEVYDVEALLLNIGAGTPVHLRKQAIFSQGDRAADLFYIRQGWVRLTMFSREGKAATVAILGQGDFLGEECLAPGRFLRLASAVAITDCFFIQVEKEQMLRALNGDRNPTLARFFTEYLLARNLRVQEDLADQLSHCSEKRLIRLLLLLAQSGPQKDGASDYSFPEISHEILAEMVGTTRPRITYFMNKFRKMGLVEYSGGLHVKKELEKLLGNSG